MSDGEQLKTPAEVSGYMQHEIVMETVDQDGACKNLDRSRDIGSYLARENSAARPLRVTYVYSHPSYHAPTN